MKHSFRRILALLLALMTLAAFPAFAFADSARYPSDQYFEEDGSLTWGYAVQISASKDYDGAKTRRDQMLRKGYDSYLYFADPYYRVMCGKFLSSVEADHYRDHICSHTDRDRAYVTSVALPDWAFQEFDRIYQSDPYNTQDEPYTSWEQPTGPYYDGNIAASTKTVYTVQISAGSSFRGEETHRDELIALGFDAFVYKTGGNYLALSGMFSTRSAAEARCSAIKAYTSEKDAYVTQVDIPTSYINYQEQADQTSYYTIYSRLLQNCAWATDYLPLEEGEYVRSNQGYELDYRYYVCDIDRNGVDELIVVDCIAVTEGIWALFTCRNNKAVLLNWGETENIPEVSVCQEKGILALQGYYKEYASCDLTYLRDGKVTGTRYGSATGEYAEIQASDVDPQAAGYYMVLSGADASDLVRLTGRTSGVNRPSSSSGYTQEGIMSAAIDAAYSNSHYETVNPDGVSLEVPADKDLLSYPFQMCAYAAKYGKAIYILPRPAAEDSHIGKVKHGELVTILAEKNGFYFFVTQDGRAGWNGISHFVDP